MKGKAAVSSISEVNQSRVTVVAHTLLAVLVGYVSTLMANWIACILGIVILFVLGYVFEKIVGKKGFKWWLGNGAIIYLFVWIVSWIYFFNILV